jgi:hypothetical protein
MQSFGEWTPAERVKYGALLLDAWFPLWHRRIDLLRIDMADQNQYSILAQLFGSDCFAHAAIRQLRLATNQEHYYWTGGFQLRADERDYGELTSHWISETVKRRLKEDSRVFAVVASHADLLEQK